jgi:allophanate hydrolase subunit 1
MKAEKAKKRIIQHCNMAIQQAKQEGIEEAINITGDILIKYQGLYDESPTINEALNRVISELKKKGIK